MTKTYVSRRPGLSINWTKPGVIPGQVKQDSIHFDNGLLVTADTEEQAYLEGLDAFKAGDIWLQDADESLAAAQSRAKSLRALADKADADANTAEQLREELDAKPRRLRELANQAEKAADSAADLVAKLQKPAVKAPAAA